MSEKLTYLLPEMTLFIATVAVLVLGASPVASRRRACAVVTFLALALAGVFGLLTPAMPGAPLPGLMNFAKPLIAAVGALLVLLVVGTVDQDVEREASRTGVFSSLRSATSPKSCVRPRRSRSRFAMATPRKVAKKPSSMS